MDIYDSFKLFTRIALVLLLIYATTAICISHSYRTYN